MGNCFGLGHSRIYSHRSELKQRLPATFFPRCHLTYHVFWQVQPKGGWLFCNTLSAQWHLKISQCTLVQQRVIEHLPCANDDFKCWLLVKHYPCSWERSLQQRRQKCNECYQGDIWNMSATLTQETQISQRGAGQRTWACWVPTHLPTSDQNGCRWL